MAKFTKYNNPNKRKHRQTLSRADADIIAAKNMIDDRSNGYEFPLSHYDKQSDQMCGKPNRKIY